MLCAAYTLIALTPIHFEGGSIEDLVGQIHAKCSVSVISEIYDGEQRIGSFDSVQDPITLAKSIRKASGYSLVVVDGVYTLSTGKLSPHLYNPRGEKYSRYPGDFGLSTGLDSKYRLLRPQSNPLKVGETVSGVTKSEEYVLFGTLRTLRGWTKQISGNQWFDELPMACCVSGVSQSKFLRAVAAVVGSKPLETKTSFVMRFDPKQYKSRFLAAANDPAVPSDSTTARGRMNIARREMAKTFVRDAYEPFLAAAFEKPPRHGSGISVDAGSALFGSVNDFAKAIADYFNSDEARDNPVRSLEVADLARLDPSLSKGFSFMPPAEFIVALPFKGGGSLAQE